MDNLLRSLTLGGGNDPYGLLAAVEIPEAEEKAPEKNLPKCPTCSVLMVRTFERIELCCQLCGLISDICDDDTPVPTGNPLLNIVGSNKSKMQSNLYRSSSGNSSNNQRKQIYDEFAALRTSYNERTGNGHLITADACRLAADTFNGLQQNKIILRTQNKQYTIAALIRISALTYGQALTRAEAADFAGLSTKGISRGMNLIKKSVAEGKLFIDLDSDEYAAETGTLFLKLKFEDPKFDELKEAVLELISIANENVICMDSKPRTRVHGATFVILKRCQTKLGVDSVDITQYCLNAGIRKATITPFVTKIKDFHSYFVEMYKRRGLSTEP